MVVVPDVARLDDGGCVAMKALVVRVQKMTETSIPNVIIIVMFLDQIRVQRIVYCEVEYRYREGTTNGATRLVI